MKSNTFALLCAAAALVCPALSTPAAAASSQLKNYAKSLSKRAAPEELKGLCVCQGGAMNGMTGVTSASRNEDSGIVTFDGNCYAVHFDPETGAANATEACDATWFPLPR